MVEEESREQIEEIMNNEEPAKEKINKMKLIIKKKPYNKYLISLTLKQKVRLSQTLKSQKNLLKQYKNEEEAIVQVEPEQLKQIDKTNC